MGFTTIHTEETPIYEETVAALGFAPHSSAQFWALLYERKQAKAPRPGVKPQYPRKKGTGR